MAILGQAGSNQQTVRETGWSVSIGSLYGELEELKSRLGILATRIEPLLNMNAESAKNASVPRTPKPKALEEIDNATARVVELRQCIVEMIERIEI